MNKVRTIIIDGLEIQTILSAIEIASLPQKNAELQQRIDKALHRIQLLQMDGEVTIRDLGLILRDLKG